MFPHNSIPFALKFQFDVLSSLNAGYFCEYWLVFAPYGNRSFVASNAYRSPWLRSICPLLQELSARAILNHLSFQFSSLHVHESLPSILYSHRSPFPFSSPSITSLFSLICERIHSSSSSQNSTPICFTSLWFHHFPPESQFSLIFFRITTWFFFMFHLDSMFVFYFIFEIKLAW